MTEPKIERVAVLGAGTMGHGIAQIAAQAGYTVRLYDVSVELAAKGLARITANLDKGIDRGKVTAEQRAAALALISTTGDMAHACDDADLVIEAAPERMDLKKGIIAEAAGHAPERAIIGTNTSSLSVTELAAASLRPAQVIGTHFFNPPYILKLLEIVRAEQTSDATLATVQAVGERMQRKMIVVADSPGFATSRLGLVIALEAMRMLEGGVASAEDIDRAMELGYAHPMGPLKLTDLVGLDVRLGIAEYLHKEIGEQFRPPPLLARMVADGKLGKKSGEGFYRYDD